MTTVIPGETKLIEGIDVIPEDIDAIPDDIEVNPKVTYDCDFKGGRINIKDVHKMEIEVKGVLQTCSKNWILVSDLQQVGSGAYSIVYGCHLMNVNTNIVKHFALKIQDLELPDIDNLKEKVNFNIKLGNADLGPQIEHVFMYKIYKYRLGSSELVSTLMTRSIIIMESFQMNGRSLFNIDKISGEITMKHSNIGFEKMLKLIDDVTKTGIFCTDIKPHNFVINIIDDDVDVKMIDFGADFCKSSIQCGYLYTLMDKDRLTDPMGFSSTMGPVSKNRIEKLINKFENKPGKKDAYIKKMFVAAWQFSLIFQIIELIKTQKKNITKANIRLFLKPAMPYLDKILEEKNGRGEMFLDELIGVIIQCTNIYNMFMWYNKPNIINNNTNIENMTPTDIIWSIFINNIKYLKKLYSIESLFGGLRKTKKVQKYQEA